MAPSHPSVSHSGRDPGDELVFHILGMLGCGAEWAWTDPCPRSLWCRQPCWAKETNKNKPKKKKHCFILSFKAGPQTASGSPPLQNVCLSLAVASWC